MSRPTLLLLAPHHEEIEPLINALRTLQQHSGVTLEWISFQPAPSFFQPKASPPSLKAFLGQADIVLETPPRLRRYLQQKELSDLPVSLQGKLQKKESVLETFLDGHALPLAWDLPGMFYQKKAGPPPCSFEALTAWAKQRLVEGWPHAFGWCGEVGIALQILGAPIHHQALLTPRGAEAYQVLLNHRKSPGILRGSRSFFLSIEEAVHALKTNHVPLVFGLCASHGTYLRTRPLSEELLFSPVPKPPHAPCTVKIYQAAVLKDAPRKKEAQNFLNFLLSSPAQKVFQSFGLFPVIGGLNPQADTWLREELSRPNDPDFYLHDHRRWSQELMFLLDQGVGVVEAGSLLEAPPSCAAQPPAFRRRQRLFTHALRRLEEEKENPRASFQSRYAAFREHQELLDDLEEIFLFYNQSLAQKETQLRHALLEKEYHHARAQQQNQALLALYRCGTDLQFSKPLAVLLKDILRGLKDALDISQALLWTWQAEENVFRLEAAIGFKNIFLGASWKPNPWPDEPEERLKLLRMASEKTQNELPSFLSETARDFLWEPLELHGRLIGLLNWKKGSKVFEPFQEILTVFLRQAALTIENARLFERVEQLARQDALTGLYNRRSLQQFLDYEIQRSRRYRFPLSLIFIDLDHFKKINDRFGHAAGDRFLRAIARKLQKLLRTTDFLARLAGDEFVAVLPCTPRDGALVLAHRLQEVLESFVLKEKRRLIRASASFGVATYEGQDGIGSRTLLSLADQAMYAAKNAGRNRVHTLTSLLSDFSNRL